jgi:hypothetical protein
MHPNQKFSPHIKKHKSENNCKTPARLLGGENHSYYSRMKNADLDANATPTA